MSEASADACDTGLRLLQAGDVEGAQRQLEAAVAADPADGRAHGLLGICHARRGNLDASISALQNAARLLPQDASAHYNLGNALFQANRHDEARAELQQTLALNPAHAQARGLLDRLAPAPAAGGLSFTTLAPAVSANTVELPSASPIAGWSAPQPAGQVAPPPPVPLGGWSQPQDGAQPPGQWSTPPVAPAAYGTPVAPQEAAYAPAAPPVAYEQPPGLGLRLLRGWLWGTVYGQWWTLWIAVSGLIFGRAVSMGAGFILYVLGYAFVYALFGSIAGIIIALADLDEERGGWVGVGIGLTLLGIEFLLFQNAFMLINVFFYFFTGRYVGSGLAGRVQRPVTR